MSGKDAAYPSSTSEVLQLLDGADNHNFFAVVGGPDGDGGAPEARARDGPVTVLTRATC